MSLKSALQDIKETTLSAVSGLLGKLAYLASLRGGQGRYEHWGMESIHGPESSERALRQAHMNCKLRKANEEIEHLAKVAERERIARDLHDVLGHTLSVITLKSELAGKLIDRDPERARKEIREVESISRQALSDVRDAIRGYRSKGLVAELAQAKSTLETAGLTVQCDAATSMVIVKATKDSEAGVLPSKELIAAMGNYNEELVKAGIMLAGEGLKPSSKGKRVRFSGRKRTVIDGPFAETKELIAGYWIWQVRSMEEAVEWLKRCPNPMPGESDVEIRPVYEAADFGENFTPELQEQEARLREQIAGKK